MLIEIEKFKGEDGKHRYRLVAGNGEKLLTSQAYARRWTRDRAVTHLCKLLPGVAVVIRDDD